MGELWRTDRNQIINLLFYRNLLVPLIEETKK